MGARLLNGTEPHLERRSFAMSTLSRSPKEDPPMIIPVNTIPGKMSTSYDSEAKAVIDTWTNYNVTLAEFREAVLNKGLACSRKNRGRAWIVDSSSASSLFSSEIQAFIASDLFPAFAKDGIKYFITIASKSAMTQLTIKNYKAQAGPHGLTLVEVDSVASAVAWLRANAS